MTTKQAMQPVMENRNVNLNPMLFNYIPIENFFILGLNITQDDSGCLPNLGMTRHLGKSQ